MLNHAPCQREGKGEWEDILLIFPCFGDLSQNVFQVRDMLNMLKVVRKSANLWPPHLSPPQKNEFKGEGGDMFLTFPGFEHIVTKCARNQSNVNMLKVVFKMCTPLR